MVDLDPHVVAVVLGMSVATYVTKAGGLWLLGRVEVSERTEAGLETLPGALVVAVVLPELAGAGPPTWAAAVLVVLVAWRTDSVLLSLLAGVGALLVLRV